MKFEIINFTSLNRKNWDNKVNEFEDATYWHSWSWLKYVSLMKDTKNISFLCYNKEFGFMGVVPLGIYNLGFKSEFSFHGVPCGSPIISKNLSIQIRKKFINSLFEKIYDLAKNNNIYRYLSINSPINIGRQKRLDNHNSTSFELLRYNSLYWVQNTSVIDLEVNEELLMKNMSKFQRKNIKKALKKNIKIEIINDKSSNNEVIKNWELFRNAHINEAGKETRPRETWDQMLENLKNGNAVLFIAKVQNKYLAYLFCGEFNKMAFGWSQVNISFFEKEFSPRHLLEWSAIQYFKKENFIYYDVGLRYYGDQIFYFPSDKELSISQFKERYGGSMMPQVFWLTYFDLDLMKSELKDNFDKFLKNYKGFLFPRIF